MRWVDKLSGAPGRVVFELGQVQVLQGSSCCCSMLQDHWVFGKTFSGLCGDYEIQLVCN